MTTWTINTNKTASTWANPSAVSTSWAYTEYEAGASYIYNDSIMIYNNGPISGEVVTYNSIGSPTTWSYSSKS